MKTPEQVLEAFGLEDITTLNRAGVERRLLTLADYTASYEASYEKLSSVLQKRTRRLRALEDADILAQQQVERLRVIAAAQAQMLSALFWWDACLGTDLERQAMAELREAMTTYRHMEAQP
jgi:hypothetical protein